MKLRCLNRLSRHEINISNLSFLIYPIFQVIWDAYIYENIDITLENFNYFLDWWQQNDAYCTLWLQL